jgi:2-(1,2-epoxy-1,2-dihydrophenyl)acetyl-CoA isomerase
VLAAATERRASPLAFAYEEGLLLLTFTAARGGKNMALVTTEFADQIAIVRFNNPAALNAISTPMVEELRAELADCEKKARALVLTGEGKAFCSGAALGGGMAGQPSSPREFDAGSTLDTHFNPLMLALRNLAIPFVTSVHGAAAGVGCSLALSGDLIVADSTAYFLQAFRNIGLVPDGGSSYLLAAAAGRARAMEAMLLGERIPAETAYSWGLINRLAPEGKDLELALELARKLADGPLGTLVLIRKLGWSALENSFAEQLVAERAAQKIAGSSPDFREGVAAFLQKRKARFNAA